MGKKPRRTNITFIAVILLFIALMLFAMGYALMG